MNSRKKLQSSPQSAKIYQSDNDFHCSEFKGINTFSEIRMREAISKKSYTSFKQWQRTGITVSEREADEIALAIKAWAQTAGINTYTYWYHPNSDFISEKYSSKQDFQRANYSLDFFCGRSLTQGASYHFFQSLSNFDEEPNEVTWDPWDPVFIYEVNSYKTLCIPTINCSPNTAIGGQRQALQKSEDTICQSVMRLFNLWDKNETRHVYPRCSPRQEFYLVNRKDYSRRYDLLLTGRTLIGASNLNSHFQLKHYRWQSNQRILNYMNEVSIQAVKLGIPITSWQPETAPLHFSINVLPERSSLAAHHNQILMDIIETIAQQHGFACLFHEQPFTHLQSNNKYLYWTLWDNQGKNLFYPSHNPNHNILLLTLIVAVVKAVYDHDRLIYAISATPGNEHRMFENTAELIPVCNFLNRQLIDLFDTLNPTEDEQTSFLTNVSSRVKKLIEPLRGQTDSHKNPLLVFQKGMFEFRSIGSTQNIFTPIAIFNTIIADSINTIIQKVKKQGANLDLSHNLFAVLKEIIMECKPGPFLKNKMSSERKKFSTQNKIEDNKSLVKILKTLTHDENYTFLKKYNILTSNELKTYYGSRLDLYNNISCREGIALIEIVQTQILPAAYDFQIEVGNSLDVLREMADDDTIPIPIHAIDDRKEMFAKLTADIYYIRKLTRNLIDTIKFCHKLNLENKAEYIEEELKPLMTQIRRYIDDLETIMPGELWQLPKYREILGQLE